MTMLAWNGVGEQLFLDGLDRGVLYPHGRPASPWNGLISVDETSAGGEATEYHYDGVKYLDLVSSEDFQATLTAFYSPRAFDECDGTRQIVPGLMITNQPRVPFDLSYRTQVGNDIDGQDHAYEIHLVWNAMASPTTRSRRTRGDSVDPTNLSWTINTAPPESKIFKPTAHLIVKSMDSDPRGLENLENHLYGSDIQDPYMPTQDEVVLLLSDVPVTEPLAAFF